MTALAARRIFTGPALQHILCWAASIGHPARSPLIRQPTRRFDVAQPATTHRLPSNEGATISVRKLNSPGGVYGPFIRREKGSAPGAFQEENRGPMVQDVPLARSRSGGFLNEGSRKAGLAWAIYTTRAVGPQANFEVHAS